MKYWGRGKGEGCTGEEVREKVYWGRSRGEGCTGEKVGEKGVLGKR